MYSKSQRANWSNVSLSRTLQQFVISQQVLSSLRNLGITAHPCTIKGSMLIWSASHLDRVKEFFKTVIENEQFIIFCIDDYHDIHTKHRPEAKPQTQPTNTATLLVKVFPNMPVVRLDYRKVLRPNCNSRLPTDWNKGDAMHGQHKACWQSELALEVPKWSSHCIETHVVVNGLEDKPQPVCSCLLWWLSQFFMRQLVYNTGLVSLPSVCRNVIPLIGPLHIWLNSRECVLLNFHQIFADLYSFLFGTKAKLAKKRKEVWQVSLLLEIIYGG